MNVFFKVLISDSQSVRHSRTTMSALCIAMPSSGLVFAVAPAPQHDYPGHSECAARVPAILKALELNGLTAIARPQQVNLGVTGRQSTVAARALCSHRERTNESMIIGQPVCFRRHTLLRAYLPR